MKHKTTAVTMFFNNDNIRSEDFYMKRGLAVLSIQSPLFILCDERTYPKIRELREQLVDDAHEKTTYVVKSFKDYDIYTLSHGIVSENRMNVNLYETNTRNTPSYYILLMMKFLAIFLAKQQNPYDSDFFAWIDFGGNNHSYRYIHTYFKKIVENPNTRVSCCYIHYRSRKELLNLKDFVDSGGCGIATNVFTVERTYVNAFYTGIMSIFHEMLLAGCGHTDEQCFTVLYNRVPDLFTIYYGDYSSVLMNYHDVRGDYNSIKSFFIFETLHKGRDDLTRSAVLSILVSVEKGTLYLPDSEIRWLKNILNIIWMRRRTIRAS